MPFGGLGIWEVLLILLVLLLVFGPRRLPELGGALGKGIREFRRSITDLRSEIAQAGSDKKELDAPKPTGAAAGDEAAKEPAKEAEP
ncbi:MAG: twin-arginine translocase TatA/TatE family subunit, partial [Gammaproteobacteria bacterium]|nr:twin-arginine translocase TatA/TatE family subunit [Gammaproteobacteria bacterium]